MSHANIQYHLLIHTRFEAIPRCIQRESRDVFGSQNHCGVAYSLFEIYFEIPSVEIFNPMIVASAIDTHTLFWLTLIES